VDEIGRVYEMPTRACRRLPTFAVKTFALKMFFDFAPKAFVI